MRNQVGYAFGVIAVLTTVAAGSVVVAAPGESPPIILAQIQQPAPPTQVPQQKTPGSGMAPMAPGGVPGPGMAPMAPGGMPGSGMAPMGPGGMPGSGMAPMGPGGVPGSGTAPMGPGGMPGPGTAPMGPGGMPGSGMAPMGAQGIKPMDQSMRAMPQGQPMTPAPQGAAMPMCPMCSGMMGMPPMGQQMPQGQSSTAPSGAVDRIEGRIAFLQAELRITQTQWPQWNEFAVALRANAKRMRHVQELSQTQSAGEGSAIVGWLDQRERMLSNHLDGVRDLKASYARLYSTMDAEQKKAADELVLPHFGM